MICYHSELCLRHMNYKLDFEIFENSSSVKPLINRENFFEDYQTLFSLNLLPFHVRKPP